MKRSYQDTYCQVRSKTYLLMALLVALGLWACDNNEKPTGPAPAGKATALDAPTNLRVEAITDTSVRVLWDAAEGATDYKVTYKPAVGGKWTNLPKGTKLYTLYTTITNLEPNTAYQWAVLARHSDDHSSWVLGPDFKTVEEETDGQVSIPDANLRAEIAKALGKASGATITPDDMATLRLLEAPNKNISDLTGLEFAINLTGLSLGGEWRNDGYKQSNTISDISPLSGLTNLTELWLGGNTISDISPLSGMTNLT
ncbi:MAG: fibronectin type III domain-containing protein, partial [Gemmatimonadetes bacterium]|nr:fibronectin type III domain-containing protein [Gemmatimonadota bacterium]